jgi:integrase
MEKDRLEGLDIYLMAKADVNFVFDRYMDTKTELRSTTQTSYLYMYNRFVRDSFGKRKIAKVRYSDVLLFYNALLDKGLQINTIDNIHTVLHPTFQMAVRDDIIRTNPTDGAMAELKKKNKKHSSVKHALTLEQERAFLNFLDENMDYNHWKPLFTVMFGTGCRIGEVIGLRWKDIDEEKNSISVNHSITYYPRSDNSYRSEFRVSLPKTEAGIRTVPMLPKVREAFQMEREYQYNTGLRNLVELDGMSDFIFCNRYGNLHNPSAINRAIKRIVDDYNAKEIIKAKREKREALILPRFSSHIARHTFCSRLCENETNVKVIQTVMGHKDIQTTLDIYAEVSEQKKQDVFSQIVEDNIL